MRDWRQLRKLSNIRIKDSLAAMRNLLKVYKELDSGGDIDTLIAKGLWPGETLYGSNCVLCTACCGSASVGVYDVCQRTKQCPWVIMTRHSCMDETQKVRVSIWGAARDPAHRKPLIKYRLETLPEWIAVYAKEQKRRKTK